MEQAAPRPPRARDELEPEGASPLVEVPGARCPYCHTDVSPGEVDAAIVCGACLARHHAGCWDDGCAACRSTASFARVDLDEGPRPELERWKWRLNLAVVAGWGLVFIGMALSIAAGPGRGAVAPMMLAQGVAFMATLAALIVNTQDAMERRRRDPSLGSLPVTLSILGFLTLGLTGLVYFALWGARPLPARRRPAAGKAAPPKA